MPVAVAAADARAQPALLYYLAAYTRHQPRGVRRGLRARPARTIDDYRGLGRERPCSRSSLVVCLLGSSAPRPRRSSSASSRRSAPSSTAGYAWLAVLAAVNTVASLFYYLRWIAPLYRDEPPELADESSESRTARHGAVTAATLSLVLGVAAGLILPLFAAS